MSTNNGENDSPDFVNFDGMNTPLKNENKDIKEKKNLILSY